MTYHDRADVIAQSENVPPFDAGSLAVGDPQLVSEVVVDRFGLPGSRHVPEVAGGRMLIVYFLPDGAMEWE